MSSESRLEAVRERKTGKARYTLPEGVELFEGEVEGFEVLKDFKDWEIAVTAKSKAEALSLLKNKAVSLKVNALYSLKVGSRVQSLSNVTRGSFISGLTLSALPCLIGERIAGGEVTADTLPSPERDFASLYATLKQSFKRKWLLRLILGVPGVALCANAALLWTGQDAFLPVDLTLSLIVGLLLLNGAYLIKPGDLWLQPVTKR